MNHLLRERAPITEAGWAELDGEARKRLEPGLAARKVVDFAGPLGWDHSATNLGRISSIDAPFEGIAAAQRRVLPLVELRAPFAVTRAELADADRGAADIDFDSLDEAAHRLAVAENAAVFHGFDASGIEGIVQVSTHEPIALGADSNDYPRHVTKALNLLLNAGVDGPYGMALGPAAFERVLESTEGGWLLLDHIRKILDGGPLVWAPGLEGAVVMSTRGGDFLFESGEDISVGYFSHDTEAVTLYLEESFSFRVATPEAAVALTP